MYYSKYLKYMQINLFQIMLYNFKKFNAVIICWLSSLCLFAKTSGEIKVDNLRDIWKEKIK